MFKVKRMTLCFDWYRNLQDHDLKYNLGLYNLGLYNLGLTFCSNCYFTLVDTELKICVQLTFLPIFQLALRYHSSERGSLFFYLCPKTVALKSDICVLHTNIWTTNILFLSPQNNVFLNFIFLGSKLLDSSLNNLVLCFCQEKQ